MPAFTLEASLVARTTHGITGFHVQGTGRYTGDNYLIANQNVTTGTAALAAGDSLEPSLLLLRNSGNANILLFADGAAGQKQTGLLQPGEFALLMSSDAPQGIGVRAASGQQLLDLMVIEGPTIDAEVSLNSLAPLAPPPGQVSARARLYLEPGPGISLGLDCAFSAEITSAGWLAPVTVSSPLAGWPVTALGGGAKFGVWGAVNLHPNPADADEHVVYLTHQSQSHALGQILGLGHPTILPWHHTAADHVMLSTSNLPTPVLLMITREA